MLQVKAEAQHRPFQSAAAVEASRAKKSLSFFFSFADGVVNVDAGAGFERGDDCDPSDPERSVQSSATLASLASTSASSRPRERRASATPSSAYASAKNDDDGVDDDDDAAARASAFCFGSESSPRKAFLARRIEGERASSGAVAFAAAVPAAAAAAPPRLPDAPAADESIETKKKKNSVRSIASHFFLVPFFFVLPEMVAPLLGSIPPAPNFRNGGAVCCLGHELMAYASGATVVILDVRGTR